MPSDDFKRSQPETLRLRALTPSLTVRDLEASLTWYRDVVGFHVAQAWDEGGVVKGYELVAGSEQIFLSQDDFSKGKDRVKGVGMRFHLETAQDIDTLAEHIQARGGTLESGPEDTPWGTRAFTVVDPDGFRFTLSSAG